MADISKQTIIEVPNETVYKSVSDPHNAPHYISSITRIVSGPEGAAPSEGQVWRAEANFMGRRSTINLCLSALRPNQAGQFTIEGEPQATLTMRLANDEANTRTRISILLDVPSVPAILLNMLMGGLLEADMGRLKRILEG
ncbi:MAG TPA: SRPBCC family protein [Chloroflexia bacterium]|nr:SRPBCC family protein [Chloroflexia bacterium]